MLFNNIIHNSITHFISIYQFKDSRSKSDNGQSNNDNSADTQTNPGSSSDRKRTLSSGAQKEDDIANEGKCTNKHYSSNDRSNELVDDPKSPEAKKSKYENSSNSVCQIDDNLEEDIGIFMIVTLSFLLYFIMIHPKYELIMIWYYFPSRGTK